MEERGENPRLPSANCNRRRIHQNATEREGDEFCTGSQDIQAGDTVLDALDNLPDIAIRGSSPGKEYISMDGSGENVFGRTLILIDGRPVNRTDMASVNWRAIPLYRIERIEVVKKDPCPASMAIRRLPVPSISSQKILKDLKPGPGQI